MHAGLDRSSKDAVMVVPPLLGPPRAGNVHVYVHAAYYLFGPIVTTLPSSAHAVKCLQNWQHPTLAESWTSSMMGMYMYTMLICRFLQALPAPTAAQAKEIKVLAAKAEAMRAWHWIWECTHVARVIRSYMLRGSFEFCCEI